MLWPSHLLKIYGMMVIINVLVIVIAQHIPVLKMKRSATWKHVLPRRLLFHVKKKIFAVELLLWSN